jgi:hypothetical protein
MATMIIGYVKRNNPPKDDDDDDDDDGDEYTGLASQPLGAQAGAGEIHKFLGAMTSTTTLGSAQAEGLDITFREGGWEGDPFMLAMW